MGQIERYIKTLPVTCKVLPELPDTLIEDFVGSITGTDIIRQCKGKLKSRHLGIPEVMLRDEKDRFLDDWTIPRLEKALGVKVHLLPCGGGALVRALLGFRLP